MPIDSETLTRLCSQISREIRDYQKNLIIYFAVYHTGEQKKALNQAVNAFMGHTAADQMIRSLKNHEGTEDSALIAVEVARQNILMGLGAYHSVLAVCAMNADEFDSENEARTKAYHFSWHALEAAAKYNEPRVIALNYKAGKERHKNKKMEKMVANLQADIFSCMASFFHQDREVARRVARKRVFDVLTAKAGKYPEYYPFPAAFDTVKFSFEKFEARQILRKKIIPMALRRTAEIVRVFDDSMLENWLRFAEPAQEMAWRGVKEGDILSVAMNVSPDTFVRAIAYQAMELSGIKPGSIFDVQNHYSLYAGSDFNARFHENLVTQAFEETIVLALRAGHALPFYDLANEQNERLVAGHIAGWCASALQSGGIAFEAMQVKSSSQAEILIRREMESQREVVKWDSLLVLSKKIMTERREGRTVVLEDIPAMMHRVEGFNSLLKSIEKTLEELGRGHAEHHLVKKSGF